jgi:hypothetical protein
MEEIVGSLNDNSLTLLNDRNEKFKKNLLSTRSRALADREDIIETLEHNFVEAYEMYTALLYSDLGYSVEAVCFQCDKATAAYSDWEVRRCGDYWATLAKTKISGLKERVLEIVPQSMNTFGAAKSYQEEMNLIKRYVYKDATLRSYVRVIEKELSRSLSSFVQKGIFSSYNPEVPWPGSREGIGVLSTLADILSIANGEAVWLNWDVVVSWQDCEGLKNAQSDARSVLPPEDINAMFDFESMEDVNIWRERVIRRCGEEDATSNRLSEGEKVETIRSMSDDLSDAVLLYIKTPRVVGLPISATTGFLDVIKFRDTPKQSRANFCFDIEEVQNDEQCRDDAWNSLQGKIKFGLFSLDRWFRNRDLLRSRTEAMVGSVDLWSQYSVKKFYDTVKDREIGFVMDLLNVKHTRATTRKGFDNVDQGAEEGSQSASSIWAGPSAHQGWDAFGSADLHNLKHFTKRIVNALIEMLDNRDVNLNLDKITEDYEKAAEKRSSSKAALDRAKAALRSTNEQLEQMREMKKSTYHYINNAVMRLESERDGVHNKFGQAISSELPLSSEAGGTGNSHDAIIEELTRRKNAILSESLSTKDDDYEVDACKANVKRLTQKLSEVQGKIASSSLDDVRVDKHGTTVWTGFMAMLTTSKDEYEKQLAKAEERFVKLNSEAGARLKKARDRAVTSKQERAERIDKALKQAMADRDSGLVSSRKTVVATRTALRQLQETEERDIGAVQRDKLDDLNKRIGLLKEEQEAVSEKVDIMDLESVKAETLVDNCAADWERAEEEFIKREANYKGADRTNAESLFSAEKDEDRQRWRGLLRDVDRTIQDLTFKKLQQDGESFHKAMAKLENLSPSDADELSDNLDDLAMTIKEIANDTKVIRLFSSTYMYGQPEVLIDERTVTRNNHHHIEGIDRRPAIISN